MTNTPLKASSVLAQCAAAIELFHSSGHAEWSPCFVFLLCSSFPGFKSQGEYVTLLRFFPPEKSVFP